MIVTTPYDDSRETDMSRSMRAHRQSVHLTLRAAAALAGVSPTLLSAWEQGTQTPTDDEQSKVRKTYIAQAAAIGQGGAR